MQQSEIIENLKLIDKRIEHIKRNSTLTFYNTGKKQHLKQLEFHKCTKKNRWVFGGNRSGKTECGAVETIWLARGIHPYKPNRPNIECWVVSLSTQVQRDVAQNKILYYLDSSWIEDIVMVSGKRSAMSMGVIDTIVIRNVFGGLSKIGFKSCDQGREKFQGTSLDFVWFDEEPPFDIYMECKMRVLDKSGEVFGTMTPLKGLTWVYNTIYLNENNDDEVWHIHMEWADNPFLNSKDVAQLTASLSKEELDARRYGLFAGANGLVYNEFNENIHVIEPFNVPPEWQDTISIDPGLKNPLSCHWYAVDYDGNIYVIAEHYASDKDIIYHSEKIKEICNQLHWKTSRDGKIEALIDSAANQKTLASSRSVSELFYDYGIKVNPRVNKDLFSGVQRVKSYLKNADGEARLFIFRNCTNMIREIKSYFWQDNDKPVKRDDHAMDDLRYYIMSKPDSPKKILQKSLVQKDKDRLIKKLTSNRGY